VASANPGRVFLLQTKPYTKNRITLDGTHYAYDELQRIYSTLFLADGLR
jgi:hypothetical protein